MVDHLDIPQSAWFKLDVIGFNFVKSTCHATCLQQCMWQQAKIQRKDQYSTSIRGSKQEFGWGRDTPEVRQKVMISVQACPSSSKIDV